MIGKLKKETLPGNLSQHLWRHGNQPPKLTAFVRGSQSLWKPGNRGHLGVTVGLEEARGQGPNTFLEPWKQTWFHHVSPENHLPLVRVRSSEGHTFMLGFKMLVFGFMYSCLFLQSSNSTCFFGGFARSLWFRYWLVATTSWNWATFSLKAIYVWIVFVRKKYSGKFGNHVEKLKDPE